MSSFTIVAGTRPNFMKIAPIVRELLLRGHDARIIHTGQHYDAGMSDVFFADLGIPAPDVQLQAGGGTQAEQTATVVVGVERALSQVRPSALVVVGDVTSTMAAALAAAKLGLPVVHVEAGLRSGDWTMPEEINRVVTDQIADLLLLPSEDARANLVREGIPDERIVMVGNVMIDSLHYTRARPSNAMQRLGLEPAAFALATLHRPANVDERHALARTLDCLAMVAERLPVVFPVHPRTRGRAADFGLLERLEGTPGLVLEAPLGYQDFVTLMSSAKLVVTDSGGVQEETTALGIPCLTMRQATERPVTVDVGTNIIVGTNPDRIREELARILAGQGKAGRVPEGWDGHAARRVVDALERFAAGSPPPKTDGPRA